MDSQDHVTALQRRSTAGPTSAPAELDYQTAWRHTLLAVKEALADLEAAANRTPVEPMAAVSSLVERLVAVATAAADAAGQHIRAEARAEVAQTQAIVAQVQEELQRERDQLKAVSQSLDTERVARGRAEAALNEARDTSERSASTYELQIRALNAELDTVRAELAAARSDLEAHRAEVEAHRAELGTYRSDVADLRQRIEKERTERATLIAAIQHAIQTSTESRIATTDSGNDPMTPAPRQTIDAELDEVSGSTSPAGDIAKQTSPQDPKLAAYARELLGRAEAMYRADVAARRSTPEIIDRLTSSLRRARLAFARRIGVTDLKETTIFEQQLAEVLDSSEETTFSRHLGIAAYESLSKPGL